MRCVPTVVIVPPVQLSAAPPAACAMIMPT
jgi:hypothetical protein